MNNTEMSLPPAANLLTLAALPVTLGTRNQPPGPSVLPLRDAHAIPGPQQGPGKGLPEAPGGPPGPALALGQCLPVNPTLPCMVFEGSQSFASSSVDSSASASFVAPSSPSDSTASVPPSPNFEVDFSDNDMNSKGTQTDLTGEEIVIMSSEIKRLKSETKLFHEEKSFENNDEKVLLFTGLPTFAYFSTLLSFLLPFLPKSKLFLIFKFFYSP